MSKASRFKSTMLLSTLLIGAVAVTTAPPSVAAATAAVAIGSSSNRTVAPARITGSVRDARGNPLSGALVSLLRFKIESEAESIVKQLRSAADGTFSTKIAPGRYALRAVADGFNATVFAAVQVSPAADLVYRFNLEPIGTNRTLPELRNDRNDPKWRLRSSQNRRSIFHHNNEDEPGGAKASVAKDEIAALEAEAADDAVEAAIARENESRRWSGARRTTHGVIETYAGSGSGFAPAQAGLNFAVANSVGENLDVVVAGQMSGGTLQRAEATASARLTDRHRISMSLGGAQAFVASSAAAAGGKTGKSGVERLEQISLRGFDEWQVRDGVVVVLGLDYTRFLGAASSSSFSPRFGVQFDVDARTRVRAAYAPGGDETALQSTIQFENQAIAFKDVARQPVAIRNNRNDQPIVEQSRRLEMGVERVLDDTSSIEATAFFDTTDGRGVGLMSLPLAAFSNGNAATLMTIANQQGAARGLRLVYARRLASHRGIQLQASAGYSFGQGQEFAAESLREPDAPFRDGFFQTVAAQLDALLTSGTRVRTVLRFSPSATVFAIDPFAGRLAVYDPSLNILVTQELPTFGLPVRAEAVIDGRNLLDLSTGIDDGETQLYVGALRRSVRGGISFRF